MSKFFDFEADFVDSLRCIPMQIRLKLDTCGIKLKLAEWNLFTAEEKEKLVDLMCQSEAEVKIYRQYLGEIIKIHTDKEATELAIDPHPPWLNVTEIPLAVSNKAMENGVNLRIENWQQLNILQRFALIKLSRSNHENSNFIPALKEFGIIE